MYHPQPSAYISPAQYSFEFEPPALAPPPPPPSQADLFSASETTELFGFLDGFGTDGFNFEFGPEPPQAAHYTTTTPPYPTSHGFPMPTPDMYTLAQPHTQPSMMAHPSYDAPSHLSYDSPSHPSYDLPSHLVMRNSPQGRMARMASSSPLSAPGMEDVVDPSKPLLTTPQKRLNHIMSEQKRRNAIRDGYAHLIGLIAPAGSQCAIAMPSRGRPKGSGNRSKNKTQGKSGVLFRAVEYIQFLEEGRDALAEEVERLEKLAGIPPPPIASA
jgi:hypothetical protein